jgi:signal transduction histidine kinase
MSQDYDKLVQKLKDKDWKVRKNSLDALIRIGAPVVGTLIDVFKDADGTIRAAAAEALGKIGDIRAVEPLIDALKDTHHSVRRAAAEALGKIGDTHAVEPLIAALDDEHLDVRMSVIWSLRHLKDVRAVESLIGTLNDTYWMVRGAAALALLELDYARAAEILRELSSQIMIVEDDWDICNMLSIYFAAVGFTGIAVHRGNDALKVASVALPKMAILDIMLPDIDGYEVCRRLRYDPYTSHIPILFLSQKDERSAKIAGLELGADDYITKPFDIEELRLRCQSILRRLEKGSEAPFQSEIDRLNRERRELLDYISDLEQERKRPEQSIRLNELGSLVSGITHDLKGGLGVIRNTIGFILDEVEDVTLVNDLHKIARSVEYCNVIIRNLSALGGTEISESTEVNIEMVAREVFFLLERKLVDIALVIEADSKTPTIIFDEGHMKQVFMNLIKNAGEAMPDGGTITVRTRREGEMLRVEVNDTGCGISPENQERVFHKSFTTKDRGYGLGLHIVDTIVKRHGGSITLESEAGKGTTFILHLPIE